MKEPSPAHIKRRERILLAALQVGLKRGLAATHMEEIAQDAGVSKGTLYNFFESREHLIVEAVLFAHTQSVTFHQNVDDAEVPPHARLWALIESLAEGFDRVVLRFPMTTQAWSLAAPGTEVHSRLGSGLNEIFMGYRRKVADLLSLAQLAGTVREDVNVNILAATWVATYNGLLYRACFDEQGDDALSTKEGVRQALGWLLEASSSATETTGLSGQHSDQKGQL